MNTLRQSRFLPLPLVPLPALSAFARTTAALCAMGALSISAAGCAGILGLEDRELDPDASGASTTSTSSQTASTSGSTGTGTASTDVVDAAPVDRDAEARDASKGFDPGDATVDAPAPVVDASSSCPATGVCYLASGLTAPWLVVADSANVYWTELGSTGSTADGAVKACAVTGCAQPLVYAAHLVGPRGIAIDTQRVYWDTQAADPSVASGGVFSCPLAGCSGAPTQLASGTQPYGLAVDGTYVYWVDEWDLSVHRVPKNGTGADHFLVAANDANNPMFDMGQVAVDATYLYVNDQTGGGLYRVPIVRGAEPTLFYDGINGFDWPVAVDSTYVYYGESDSNNVGHILRINKATPSSMTAIATGLSNPYGVAVDGPTSPLVYWADNGTGSNDGAIGRVSALGTGQVNLATSLSDPSGIAVNASYVFWTDLGLYDGSEYVAGGGFIARVAK